MRSPISTKGRSKPMTTSLVAELMTVSVMSRDPFPCCAPPLRARLAVPHDAGRDDDLGDELLLAVGHDVHAGHARDLADLLDELDAKLLALALLVGGPFEALDHGIRNMDPGNVLPHPTSRPGRSQRPDADQDEALLVQPELAHPSHKSAQEAEVETILCLDELGAGRDLLGEMAGPVLVGGHERVGGRTQEHLRGNRDLPAGEEASLLPHGAD